MQARDPETGDVQWTWHTVPQKKGDPGMETWGSLEGARARRRQRVDSRLLRSGDEVVYFRHRQSVASYTRILRAAMATTLYTCSLVAVNVETGRWPGITS